MPEMDGLEVVREVGTERMPVTIFVTAYDRYALRAFDVNAVDYLLKPFGKERFERALKRAKEHIAGPSDRKLMERIAAIVARRTAQDEYLERLPVTEGGHIFFVKISEIDWIAAEGNYARLHVGARQHQIRETLTNLEARLNPRDFVRIHRSTIVNAHRIREIHPWFRGHHLVVLKDGHELRMSRYQRDVAERLGLGKKR
jgi:two-component system LytT family response regulator